MKKRAVMSEIKRRNVINAEQKRKFREDKIKKALESVKTRVDWPDIPKEDDPFGLSESLSNISLNNTAETTATTPKKYKSWKPPLITSFATTATSPDKSKSRESFLSVADKFIKASNDTRDFIREIEEKELLLHKSKHSKP